MAAADYYNARPSTSQQTSFLTPPPAHRTSSTPAFVYPQSHSAPNGSPHQPPQFPSGPPPYQQPLDSSKPNVHFAPSPPPPQQRNSFSHPQRPNLQQWNGSFPPPPPTSHLQPGPYQPQPNPYQQPTYPAPHMRPYMHENQSETSLGSGYSSDPERHRRKRKHKEGRERGNSTNSRSTTTDGFLGAAGGGLIGDLIFPGLGTVGGALAGWLGGKDYGNHRKWREEKREREQKDWEKKFGQRDEIHHHHHHHEERSRSRSRDRRRS